MMLPLRRPAPEPQTQVTGRRLENVEAERIIDGSLTVKTDERGKRLVLAPIQSVTPYIAELRAAHGLYRQWADDPDQALNTLDVIEGDPVVKSCAKALGLLAVGQCGHSWSIMTDEQELSMTAGVVESGLRKAREFLNSRMHLAKAVLRGLCLVSVRWEKRVCRLRPDLVARQWVVPVAMTPVDKRRLRLYRIGNRRDIAYWGIWDPTLDQFVMIEDRDLNPDVADGFARQDFIWYWADRTERSAGFGEGEGDQLYEIVGISQRVRQYRARLAERWAEPTFIYGLNVAAGVLTEATMGEAFKSPYDRAEEFHEMMKKWRARHSITKPHHDSLEIHEHGGPSAAALEDFMRYLDDLKVQSIMLGNLMGSTGEGNSFGDSGEAEERADLVAANAQYHRHRIEEACDEYLVHEFVRRNATTLIKARLPIPYEGDLHISFASKRATDPEMLAKRLEVAKSFSLPIGQSWLAEELDIPSPKPGEKIAVAAPDPAMGMGAPAGASPMPFAASRAYVPRWRKPADEPESLELTAPGMKV